MKENVLSNTGISFRGQNFDVDAIKNQADRELESIKAGIDRFDNNYTRAAKDDRAGDSKQARSVAKPYINAMAELITDHMLEQETSKKKKTQIYNLLHDAKPVVLSGLTLSCILAEAAKMRKDAVVIDYNDEQDQEDHSVLKRNALAAKIAQRVQTERHLETVYENNPKWFDHLTTQTDYVGSRLSPDALSDALEKIVDIPLMKNWTDVEKSKVGHVLLDWAIMVGFVSEDTFRNKQKTTAIIVLSPLVQDNLERLIQEAALLRPTLRPMICKPLDWSTASNGGYLTHRVPLVKRFMSDEHKKRINNETGKAVYQAINAAQSTPWLINEKMCEVVQWCFDENKEIAGLTGTKAATTSLRISTSRALQIADDLKGKGEFYFPHNMDYRGRLYPMPETFHPQATKPIKSMMQFSDAGEKLTDEDFGNVFWLKMHVATCAGAGPNNPFAGIDRHGKKTPVVTSDKTSIEDRVKWTERNQKKITRIVADYQGTFDEWKDFDDPFNFLAAAFELVAFWNGEDVYSRVSINFDGSCSGLQHVAALFKDEKGGEAVNLVPGLDRKDVYEQVMKETIRRLKKSDPQVNVGTEKGPEMKDGGDLAALLSRNVTKRPTMTYTYGSDAQGMVKQVQEQLPDEHHAVHQKIALFIYNAIEGTCPGAALARDWLQEIAKEAARNGKAMVWTTPDGLPVEHLAFVQKMERPEYYLNGKRRQPAIIVDTPKISSNRMKNGASPHLVHSLDATHLRMVALAARNAGMPVGLIHDSFGTNSTNAQKLFNLIRAQFVTLYQQPVLENLMKEFGVDTCPPVGKLDIAGIAKTEFSFA